MPPRVKVEQNPDKPVERPVLAEAIVKISEAVDKLFAGGLNRRAVVALIRDNTSGISKHTIGIVLDVLQDLRRDYCR